MFCVPVRSWQWAFQKFGLFVLRECVDEVVVGRIGGSRVFVVLECGPSRFGFAGPWNDEIPDDGIATEREVFLQKYEAMHGNFNGVFGF